MLPDRFNFLGRFDNFYKVVVNSVKESKVSERDFYALIIAKAKTMEKERREEVIIKVEYTE
ncbi:hypothetical protein ES695_07270 [Candidatus Atribacteria bacterium 1244-E10-H5-B2]|nr:MAG: hypothetical protein ES695_07270 [Candidatus Atribacteria bacterium 1244-E10-H5-B2]